MYAYAFSVLWTIHAPTHNCMPYAKQPFLLTLALSKNGSFCQYKSSSKDEKN